MGIRRKIAFPVSDIRRFLEPGPVVLVSSAWKGQRNIMTMGWRSVISFSPSLVACILWEGNHSHAMVRRSRECVINLPTLDMAETVARIGNCSGAEVDKFQSFGLTPVPAEGVSAPMIGECHACLECRVTDTTLVRRYNLFILEVVRAHAAARPRHPRTIHYRGDGQFMVSGDALDLRRLFQPQHL